MRLIVPVVAVVLSVPAISAAGRQGGEKVILDARRSYWRFRIVWQTEEVILDSGKVDHVLFKFDRQWFYRHPKQIAVDKYTVEKVPMVRLPATTSPDWMKNDSRSVFLISTSVVWNIELTSRRSQSPSCRLLITCAVA